MNGKAKKFFRAKFSTPMSKLIWVWCNGCPLNCSFQATVDVVSTQEEALMALTEVFRTHVNCVIPTKIHLIEISHNQFKKLGKISNQIEYAGTKKVIFK